MDESPVPKRSVRIEIEKDCLDRVAEEAESRQTTAPLLIAMMVRDQFPAPDPPC